MSAEFSSKLLLLRRNAGLSQKQAAAELGISQALLSHYEKGIRECSLDFAVKAAEYYNVTSDYMLGVTSSEKTSALTDENTLPSDRHAEPLTILRALIRLSETAEATDDESEEFFTDFFSLCIKKYLAALVRDGKSSSGLCSLAISSLCSGSAVPAAGYTENEPTDCIASAVGRADILIKKCLDNAL